MAVEVAAPGAVVLVVPEVRKIFGPQLPVELMDPAEEEPGLPRQQETVAVMEVLAALLNQPQEIPVRELSLSPTHLSACDRGF
jgi:hypothetical protein